MSKAFTSDLTARRGYHHGNLREALMEAARRLVAENGPHGFTLAEAARLAGVSPGAVYRHFDGRESLVAELGRRGFDQFRRWLQSAVENASSPMEALVQMGHAYLTFAREEPGFYGAMFSGAGMSQNAPMRDNDEGSSGAFGLLLEGLERALPKERNHAVDGRLLALQVWSMSHGLARLEASGQLPAGPDLPSPEDILVSAVNALLSGYSQAPT